MYNNDQVGCGYCANEKICEIKVSTLNLARLGCPCFTHFDGRTTGEPYTDEQVINWYNALANSAK